MNDKWEYKTLYIGKARVLSHNRIDPIDDELNRLGQEGWEAFSHLVHPYDSSDVYKFKRKIS